MRLFRILRNRIRALVGRDGVVDEIHEEIQFHLDARSVEHQRRGLSPDEARRAALRKFGNPSVVEDQGYDVRGGGVMESFVQDARYGMRLLWKQRGFSAVALLTLALGTGATTAIFCVVDAALIRPLPYDKPEQLVRVGLVAFSRPDVTTAPSLVDMDDWRTLTHVFSHLGTTKSETAILLEGSDPERVNVTLATLDYLPMYGRTPFIGRPFTADDEQLGARAVLVKGGHRHIDAQALDVLLTENGIFTEFRTDYINAGEVHGSGCTLSAALAACLAKGLNLEEAVSAAKKYVTDAIRNATRLGHGAMPL